MGGERETLVPQKTRKTDGSSHEIGQIRIHESNGEVHFHDDTNKLKVAVPSATWFSAFEKALENMDSHEWSYVDPKQKAVLTMKCRIRSANPKKDRPIARAEVTLRIEKIELSDELAKLNKFTNAN